MIEINLGILIAQIVTFIIAVVIIWKLAWGPLTEMMKERRQSIKNDLETAQNERRAAEEAHRAYEQRILDAHLEAQKIVDRALKDGEEERTRLHAQARKEAELIAETARRSLQEEKERLTRELRAEVAGLSVEIAEKLIQQSIDRGVQENVLARALREIEGKS